MIWADAKLDDEADLEKKNLISDLVEGMLDRDDSQASVIFQIRELVTELERVVDRSSPPDPEMWQPIEELEASPVPGVGIHYTTAQSSSASVDEQSAYGQEYLRQGRDVY